MTGSIQLSDVHLWRSTQEELSYDIKKTVFSILEGKYKKPKKRLVLEGVSLSISPGQKIGIIGANGSGKSTLLKVICGILEPTLGSVKVTGNIASLIELEADFDRDLSVRDNIIMYVVLMGFPKHVMTKKVGEILEFAELSDYAYMPVKGLSSGMAARLGFAIATDVNADILIIDEVLSVGDQHFQHKSKTRINSIWHQKTTVLVVSHDLDFIQRSCEQVIVLKEGKIIYQGSPEEAITEYLAIVN